MQFSKIIGQVALKQQLIKEVNSGKISHAKLFVGESGYGTLPLALAFVQYLFCKNKQEKDSCGTCDSCVKVTNLQHPDLHFSYPVVLQEAKTAKEVLPLWRSIIHENPYFNLTMWTNHIDPKGRVPVIGTDEGLEIIKSLSLKSFEGGYKVMLIWGAEEMNTVTSNKLLKILEEPPAKTIFILIGTSTNKFLQTILSRTQITRVPRIEVEDISQFLMRKYQLNLANANTIAIRSEGNLIEAIDFATANPQANSDRDLFIELMRVCYKKDVPQMISWSEKISGETKDRQKNFILYCLHMFRQSLLKNYTNDVLLRVSNEEAEFLSKFARFVTGNNIIPFYENFNNAHYYIERNANPKLIFTNLCFNVMRFIHVA